MVIESTSHKRDFTLFFLAILCGGFAQAIVDATFNNFLTDIFHITTAQRSFLEFPREIPGFIVIFVSVLLSFMCNRRLAAFARLLAAVGVFMLAFASVNYHFMVLWLFVFSMGQHIFMPLSADIGMEFAKDGSHGKTLGRLSGFENFAGIIGSLVVFLGFRYLYFSYTVSFIVSGLVFLVSAVLIFSMERNKPTPAHTKLKLRKEYGLFYWLIVLYGTRKQIFMTFAPWILITVYHQKVQSIAILLFVGGVIGIGFKPLLGHLIDKIGEKTIIAAEGLLLIFVCLGYGFAGELFTAETALIVIFVCYVADQLLMSVSMARAIYLKKIAVNPSDVTSTLTMSTSIDHIFSISIALLGGVIWSAVGYKYIFLLGAIIALISGISALYIKTGKLSKNK